ncbi:sodium-dependent transporter [Marinilabiliaceae bacterium JC017]|nr:sodium-dependent transporter [Marinilabiliaceae bacterium JC017]
MANIDSSSRDGFTSKFGVIAAAAGSAIGLGNIWKFPYEVGNNGGGAFLLIYLFFIVAIGIPVMLSELMIGRKAQKNVFGAFKLLAPHKAWRLVGVMGVFAAFLILSFYAVVAGWTLEYVYLAVTNGLANKTPEEINNIFDVFMSGKLIPVLWTLLFMLLTALVVLGGIKNGIEKYTKVLMPLLLVIIIVLDIKALTLEGAGEGLAFLFNPDFAKITPQVILSALGQAFFSLSIGMGVIATYGSYIPKSQRLGNTAISVSFADTLIALLAGIAIFPAVFAFGMEPAQDEGLVFRVLPNIFNQMAGGSLFQVLFFLLLCIAALTSSISLLEVIVAYMSEELKIKRRTATWATTGFISGLGVLCVLFSSVFGAFVFISSNVLLPLGGLFIVIFVGYVLKQAEVKQELEAHGGRFNLFKVFIFIVRYIAPIAIGVVFLKGIGVIDLIL